MKCHNDGNWMSYRGCLLVAAIVKIVSCLANSIFCTYTYADKTSIEVCIPSYWLQLFMHTFRDGLARSLKMEAIFVVIKDMMQSQSTEFSMVEPVDYGSLQ